MLRAWSDQNPGGYVSVKEEKWYITYGETIEDT